MYFGVSVGSVKFSEVHLGVPNSSSWVNHLLFGVSTPKLVSIGLVSCLPFDLLITHGSIDRRGGK